MRRASGVFFGFGLATGFVCTTNLAQDFFEAPVRVLAVGEPIDSGPNWGHSGPCYADVDGDQVRDLLVGDFSGKFQFYRNIGSEAAPQFAAGKYLQAGGVDAEVWVY